jgi:hypothetical protein
MGSEITGSACPFDGGVWGYCAVCAILKRGRSGTALAGFDDRMTPAAVEIAPFSGHKCTFDTLFQGYALHCLPPVILESGEPIIPKC